MGPSRTSASATTGPSFAPQRSPSFTNRSVDGQRFRRTSMTQRPGVPTSPRPSPLPEGDVVRPPLAEHPFVESLLRGMEVQKLRRWQKPHPKVLWLDVSHAAKPAFRWNDPPGKNPLEARTLGLFDIASLTPGTGTSKKARSHREVARRVMYFAVQDPRDPERVSDTLDLLFDSEQDRQWFFDQCHKMFAAYAEGLKNKFSGPELTDFVRRKIDG